LPQASTLPPARSDALIASTARAIGPASGCAAATLSLALSAKCAAMRSASAAF